MNKKEFEIGETIEFSDEGNAIMLYVHKIQEAQDHNFKELEKTIKAINNDLKLIRENYVTKTNFRLKQILDKNR